MTINHIHIATQSIEASKKFYNKFLGFKVKFDHGDGVFLEDSTGYLLAIDPVKEAPKYPSWFHVGFCLNSINEVKELYDQMKAGDVKFAKDYEVYGEEEAASFYALDPDGLKIEVSWHND